METWEHEWTKTRLLWTAMGNDRKKAFNSERCPLYTIGRCFTGEMTEMPVCCDKFNQISHLGRCWHQMCTIGPWSTSSGNFAQVLSCQRQYSTTASLISIREFERWSNCYQSCPSDGGLCCLNDHHHSRFSVFRAFCNFLHIELSFSLILYLGHLHIFVHFHSKK